MHQCNSEEFSQTVSNNIYFIGIHFKQGMKFQDRMRQR